MCVRQYEIYVCLKKQLIVPADSATSVENRLEKKQTNSLPFPFGNVPGMGFWPAFDATTSDVVHIDRQSEHLASFLADESEKIGRFLHHLRFCVTVIVEFYFDLCLAPMTGKTVFCVHLFFETLSP